MLLDNVLCVRYIFSPLLLTLLTVFIIDCCSDEFELRRLMNL